MRPILVRASCASRLLEERAVEWILICYRFGFFLNVCPAFSLSLIVAAEVDREAFLSGIQSRHLDARCLTPPV